MGLLAATASNLPTVIVGGLGTGWLYAVFVVGILLIYQVSKQMSFAYGQNGMVGALGAWYLYAQLKLPVVLAALLGIAIACAVAVATEAVVIRRLPRDKPGFDLAMTLGLYLLLTTAAQQLFGTGSYPFLGLLRGVSLRPGNVYINGGALLDIGVGIVVSIAIYLALTKTKLGIELRASAESPEVASAAGINVRTLRTVVWGVAGILVAICAYLFGSQLSVNTDYMTPILIVGFVAAMLGRLDRYWAPVMIAVALGLYESLVGYFFGPNATTPADFGVILVGLSVLPARWVTEKTEARA